MRHDQSQSGVVGGEACANREAFGIAIVEAYRVVAVMQRAEREIEFERGARINRERIDQRVELIGGGGISRERRGVGINQQFAEIVVAVIVISDERVNRSAGIEGGGFIHHHAMIIPPYARMRKGQSKKFASA